MKLISYTLALLVSLGAISKADTHFVGTTKSLQQYKVPEWYQDAKLGYWVHWGVYSVIGYDGKGATEWYGRNMYETNSEAAKFHLANYGDSSKFGYKDFVPMWKAEKFDADSWVTLFKEGGGRFFTMMGMHHDNFPLWDSETTPFNSVNYGPKKDFVALMEKATRKQGLYFGLSNHSAWNSRFFEFNHKNEKDAVTSKHSIYGSANPDAEDVARWWARSTEMVEKYKPDFIWFDWCWGVYPYGMQTRMNYAAWYYNQAMSWGKTKDGLPNVALAHKNQLPYGTAVMDVERGNLDKIYPGVWMNDTSLGYKSWAYNPSEAYKDANQIVDMLIDIVSKNGVLMLNIGPKADGSIPDEAQKRIRQIGQWLKVNGEGVYNTRAWICYGEGPTKPSTNLHGDQVEYTNKDIRFTRSKDNKTLYIHILGYSDEVMIEALKSDLLRLNNEEHQLISLASGKKIAYKIDTNGMSFKLPSELNKNDFAYSFKIDVEEGLPQLKE